MLHTGFLAFGAIMQPVDANVKKNRCLRIVTFCSMFGMQETNTKNAGFNLSVGCFGPTLSKIASNGQIWEFTGSRVDHSAPNYVARLF